MMNNKVVFTWHPNEIIQDLKLHNVYGFCVNKENKVALVRDKGETRFTLPGGGVQNGESALEALIREFNEEVQFTPQNIELMGSLEVKEIDETGQILDHHQQIRFFCTIDNYDDFVPEKDGWETVERIFVDPEELPKYLEWIDYPSGKEIFDDFLKINFCNNSNTTQQNS